MESIGQRVRSKIGQSKAHRTQRDVAAAIDMSPDAFSRALSGQRNFSSIELAKVAEVLDEDVYWLITGEVDPHKILVTARHDFDHATGDRRVPGYDKDKLILNDVGLAYRQGYPQPLAASTTRQLPATPAGVREALGDDCVRNLADRTEDRLGIDVVRLPGLTTAYSMMIGGRRVIVTPANLNWFRVNWDLAHELGHFVFNHHDSEFNSEQEAAANKFAAELLLPQGDMTAVDWETIDNAELARIVWEYGVSTKALGRRLKNVLGSVPALVAPWQGVTTQRLLRRYLATDSTEFRIDAITQRMEQSTTRRFPLHLLQAHLSRIAAGEITKATLAWMLDMDADDLDVDMPEPQPADLNTLAADLGMEM